MKGNKSRRSVANDRVNSFLNNKSVGIKTVRISEAGNIEIKFIAWCLSSAQLKLRVNLTTLTFTFEQYGTRNQQGIRNIATKRKAIDTAINGDKNFFETEMLAFLENKGFTTRSKMNDVFKDLYMVQWGELKPEPIPTEVPDYVRYAADSLKLEADKNQRRYEVIKAIHDKGSTISGFQLEAEKQYAALMRDRDGTPLFTDDQFDEMFNNADRKYTMLPSELNVSYPDLDIVEERSTKGDLDYYVTARKLTDEQVSNLLNVVERPPTKLQEIMDNLSADGKVTVTIDIDTESTTTVDEVETVRIQVNKDNKGGI